MPSLWWNSPGRPCFLTTFAGTGSKTWSLGKLVRLNCLHACCLHACGSLETCTCEYGLPASLFFGNVVASPPAPCITQVFKVNFWLMHYGSGSPKPLQVRSNWRHISEFDLGRLSKKDRERLTTLKTTSLVLILEFVCAWMCTYMPPCWHVAWKPQVAKENNGLERSNSRRRSLTLKIASGKLSLCALLSQRSYPRAFGEHMVKTWKDSPVEPMRSLRTKPFCMHKFKLARIPLSRPCMCMHDFL